MIRFVAELECDNKPCTETGRVGVRIEMQSGCSPFGGGPCSGELDADTYGTGWSGYGDGTVRCPKCVADMFRFGVAP